MKELMAGHNLDLIDDIDFVKGNDDSHGFTLKNYIEYLAKEIYWRQHLTTLWGLTIYKWSIFWLINAYL